MKAMEVVLAVLLMVLMVARLLVVREVLRLVIHKLLAIGKSALLANDKVRASRASRAGRDLQL